MIALTLVKRCDELLPRKFLTSWVARLHQRLPVRDRRRWAGRELVIVWVGPAEGRCLNRQYRRRDYATDVLSFAGVDSESLGDLVICPAVVRRQAKDHGHSFRDELGYLVLHGVLHLLGYDHERNARAAARMYRLQDRLFAQLLSLPERR